MCSRCGRNSEGRGTGKTPGCAEVKHKDKSDLKWSSPKVWENTQKTKNYLLVIGVEVNVVAVVDVDGPPVIVLQGGSHHQVREAVVVEVWSCCQSVTKPGILGLFLRFKSSIRHKHLLLEEEREKEVAYIGIILIKKRREGNDKHHSCLTPVKE